MLSEHDFAEVASAKNCVTFEIVDRNIFIWNCRSFKASCWKLSWSWLWLLLLLGVHLLTIHIFLDLETRRHSVFRRILGRFGRNFAWCMPGYIWNVDLWWVLVGDKERNTRRWFQRVIFIALLMRNRMVIVLWWVHRSVVRWMMRWLLMGRVMLTRHGLRSLRLDKGFKLCHSGTKYLRNWHLRHFLFNWRIKSTSIRIAMRFLRWARTSVLGFLASQ